MNSNEIRQRQSIAAEPKEPPRATKKRGESTEKTKLADVNNELKKATSPATHRPWTRAVVITAVMVLVYFYTKNRSRETKFAVVSESLPLRMQKFTCSDAYEAEVKQYPQCVPRKCGRFVSDKLVEPIEVELLLDFARSIIGKAGSSGGASILDVHTGALSHKDKFLNVYSVPQLAAEFREEHLNVYNLVKGKVKLAIAEQFGIPESSLYLTYPTFFSRITNVTAKTVHDEYWHEHVDKETYPSFHYTSLLYLNNHNLDFQGGRFIFVDGFENNRTTSSIEPKKGRISAFTSGAENRHYVEQVTAGERFAVTISFTCDEKLGIGDPKIKPMQG